MKKNSKNASQKNVRAAEMAKESAAPKYNAKSPAAAPKAPAKAPSSPAPSKPAPKAPAAPAAKEAPKAPALPGRTPEGKAAAVKSASELAKTVVPAKADAKDAKAAKAPKAPKTPKEKPFAKSSVEVDTSAYYKEHDKLPGTGKRAPKTLWKFLIGKTPFSMETEFFRTARLAAVQKAVELKETKVAVLA